MRLLRDPGVSAVDRYFSPHTLAQRTLQIKVPRHTGRGAIRDDWPWRKGYLPFFAGFLAALFVVFFETGFLAVAMCNLLPWVKWNRLLS